MENRHLSQGDTQAGKEIRVEGNAAIRVAIRRDNVVDAGAAILKVRTIVVKLAASFLQHLALSWSQSVTLLVS